MTNNIFGIVLTFIMPFGVIALSTLVKKLGAQAETSRKFAHILLSNWILLAMMVYDSAWVAVAPACFIVLNYIDHRKKFFTSFAREDEEENTLGTVWYAVSLFVLCLVGFGLDMPWIAACGILAMGYGDGLGSLIGHRWGRSRFSGMHSKKSLEGTITVMVFSGLAVYVVCMFFAPHIALYAAFAGAVPAAAVELYSPRGTDNLTLPISVSLIVFLLYNNPYLWPFFACLSLTLLISIASYYLRAVTFWALHAATLLGVLLFVFGGWLSFSAIILFFLLGNCVSRVGKARKADAYALHERHGPRKVAQVAANGLPALIFAAVYYLTGNESYLLVVIACIAAAAADTFSSELGMLSGKQPVSIATFKPIQRGISGGVTMLGMAGAVLGSALISVLAFPQFGVVGVLAVIAMGIVGSLADSVLGAVFQAKYQTEMQQLTERENLNGTPLKLVQGAAWINNDVVNFTSVLASASAFTFALYFFA